MAVEGMSFVMFVSMLNFLKFQLLIFLTTSIMKVKNFQTFLVTICMASKYRVNHVKSLLDFSFPHYPLNTFDVPHTDSTVVVKFDKQHCNATNHLFVLTRPISHSRCLVMLPNIAKVVCSHGFVNEESIDFLKVDSN